jgi:sialidase-1
VRNIFLPFVCIIAMQLFSFSQVSTVFKSGTEGHKIYRIPAVVILPNKKIIAFAEGRVQNSSDFGDINIVMKTSVDKGKTWSPLKIIVNQDSLQAGNPAPVIDLMDPDFPQGVIYLFYNTGNNHEGEVRKGKGVREVWFIKSYDGAQSWSKPVNITLQTHRPNHPEFNPAYTFKEDWRSYANTPGHAFQFQDGKYKGRIFVAANHSAGEPQKQFRDYAAHGFFTDDHGKTFILSTSINIPGSNESMGTELSNSRMMMGIRNQRGDIKSRILSYSSDGGQHWDSVYFDSNLPDPVCQGSILTIGYKKGKAIIASCNAADPNKRDNLTLRISYDEGQHWNHSIVVEKSEDPSKRDWAAYSDLLLLDKKKVGILYERNNYAEIVFKTVEWSRIK